MGIRAAEGLNTREVLETPTVLGAKKRLVRVAEQFPELVRFSRQLASSSTDRAINTVKRGAG